MEDNRITKETLNSIIEITITNGQHLERIAGALREISDEQKRIRDAQTNSKDIFPLKTDLQNFCEFNKEIKQKINEIKDDVRWTKFYITVLFTIIGIVVTISKTISYNG